MKSVITILSEWLGLKKTSAESTQSTSASTGMVTAETASPERGVFPDTTFNADQSQNDPLHSVDAAGSAAGENSGSQDSGGSEDGSGSDGGHDSGGGWDSGGGGGWS